VEVALLHHGRVLLNYPVGEDEPLRLKLSLAVLAIDFKLWVDLYLGALVGDGNVKMRWPIRRWRTILSANRRPLLRFDPSVGEIGGSDEAHEPRLKTKRFGRTRLCSSEVLRVYVADRPRLVADVGQIVKRQVFPGPQWGEFVFNTVAVVGAPDDHRNLGKYTDPSSPWFNVFIGYYEIDVSIEQWKRPFGYRSDRGVDSELEIEELMRLGKADWNWFSNWMYGVPEQYIKACNEIEPIDPSKSKQWPEVFACDENSPVWHKVTLHGAKVASSYESDAPGAAKLVSNTLLSRAWRDSFGLPNPQKGVSQSFFPTSMHADVYASYRKDEDAGIYRSFFFGATARIDENDQWDKDFIDAQLAALERVICSNYRDLGFPLPPVEVTPPEPGVPAAEGRFISRALASASIGTEASGGNPPQSG
jgi:hypothetical protein